MTRKQESQLMASAMAGAAFQAAKQEAGKFKKTVIRLRDGPASIRVMSYMAGIMLVVTGFFAFFGSFITLHPIDAMVHLYMLIFGWIIVFIEARNTLLPKFFVENIHKYMAFTTVVWGRGVFFIFIGTLALAQWDFMDILLGIYLVGLGVGMIFWGQQAYRSLDALMAEMKDPAVVTDMFTKFDHNGDGVLSAKELGALLASLGANMTPTEVEAAIIIMDTNNDGKIHLPEFQGWWSRYDPPSLIV